MIRVGLWTCIAALNHNRILKRRESRGYLHVPSIPHCLPGSFDHDLLQLLAEHSAIVDSSNEADQVNQAGETMDTSKALVQGGHLLRVRRWVIALLAIPSFYKGQVSSWFAKDAAAPCTWLLAKEETYPDASAPA